MSTLIETMQRLDSLRHKKAVWEALVLHLGTFTEEDSGYQEQKILADGAVQEVVPESVIGEFIILFEEQTRHIDKKVYLLENSEVTEKEEESLLTVVEQDEDTLEDTPEENLDDESDEAVELADPEDPEEDPPEPEEPVVQKLANKKRKIALRSKK